MAESNNDIPESTNKLTVETSPRALAEINYNSLIATDRNTSSDDEGTEPHEIPDEDARTAIGISIGREQTRLTSPKTPAVEKVAAIERAGGFFEFDGSGIGPTLVEELEENDDVQDNGIQEQDGVAEVDKGRSTTSVPSQTRIPERSPRKTPVRLPSPWRVESSVQWYQSSKGKSGLLDGLFNRKRSSTGPDSTLARSFLSSLPSMPKSLSTSSSSGSTNDVKATRRSESEKRASAHFPISAAQRDFAVPSEQDASDASGDASGDANELPASREKDRHAALEAIVSPTSVQTVRSRATLLRRSTSDQSLVTQRTLSRVESLGDDSRFENVHDQVNSRLKAIKDSWQDSNIKLPSLPNLNMASFTPDFIRDRSGSVNKRLSIRPADNAHATTRDLDTASRPQRPVDPMTRQPYTSPKAAVADTTSGKTSNHPHFKRAREQLEGDVVILGGYRGSILRSADPPHRQLWVPVKVGLNLRKADLQVGFEEGSDELAADRIIPGGMLTHIGPVDISRRLFKRLRACKNAQSGKLRVHDYGYDWRLDPNYLSNQLISFLETLSCNKRDIHKDRKGATVIAHSLGGLITRHAVNRRPELFRGVVYAGVPTTCVNILGPLRNGDEVLLSNRVLTAQVNFSIRTSFALLPLDGRCFVDKNTKEEYPVDFFDPATWIDLRLSPCVSRPLPPLSMAPKPTGITSYVSSMTSVLPSLPLPGRKSSKTSSDVSNAATARSAAEPDMLDFNAGASGKTVANGNVDSDESSTNNSVATTVTISRDQAVEYLTRTLKSVKRFKEELAFNPTHSDSNSYPPISLIYGKSTPTVYGAKVDGREGIKHADAYDQLAFASGDGVVLARAAMVPEGYKTARGGVVSSERGHVTLLSDLEAVGKCLNAVMAARRKGVGLGN